MPEHGRVGIEYSALLYLRQNIRIRMNIFENRDCMDGMKEYPDNHFDLAIVDPPYGINFAKQHTGKGWIVRESKKWDEQPPELDYFVELARVSKNQIIWGGNYFTQFIGGSQGWIVWNKGQRNFSLADGELAFTSFDRALRIFDYSRAEANQDYFKIHPTKKPVKLYKWILENYAKPGQLILDTHVGSASSLIACIDMGFDYVGYELDTDYFKAATERIERHQAQGDLFEPARTQAAKVEQTILLTDE